MQNSVQKILSLNLEFFLKKMFSTQQRYCFGLSTPPKHYKINK